MLKTTKLMHALWSSRNRVWGVWARSAFVLCEKSWMKRQIGGTTCAISYYLSIVSSILSGVSGICIIFELPEVQLIHQLVHPDDDCNSCSFSETFLWQNMLTSLKWRVKLQDFHHFDWWKYQQRFRLCYSCEFHVDVFSLSPWRLKKIYQVLSLSASQCVERRAGAVELSYRSFLVSWDDN